VLQRPRWQLCCTTCCRRNVGQRDMLATATDRFWCSEKSSARVGTRCRVRIMSLSKCNPFAASLAGQIRKRKLLGLWSRAYQHFLFRQARQDAIRTLISRGTRSKCRPSAKTKSKARTSSSRMICVLVIGLAQHTQLLAASKHREMPSQVQVPV
jgi:hypothetical protein